MGFRVIKNRFGESLNSSDSTPVLANHLPLYSTNKKHTNAAQNQKYTSRQY
jgi:hypothetical protein